MSVQRAALVERCAYTAVSVVLSLAVTAAFSYGFYRTVRLDFMITGGVCSAVVTWFVAGYGLHLKMQLELARRHEQQLLLREEKLATLHQVMHKAQHHVNNLAMSLQLVELEYQRDGVLCTETIKALQRAVHDAGQEMGRLGRIDDPFDPAPFDLHRSGGEAPSARDGTLPARARREA